MRQVQENCIDLVGRIADRGAEFVPAREWMRICFELLEMLKAHKKGIRRATVNTFGYIAKAIGPQVGGSSERPLRFLLASLTCRRAPTGPRAPVGLHCVTLELQADTRLYSNLRMRWLTCTGYHRAVVSQQALCCAPQGPACSAVGACAGLPSWCSRCTLHAATAAASCLGRASVMVTDGHPRCWRRTCW